MRIFTPRTRPAVTALDHVSLTIPVGEIHGLLGPNGAGKTILVKILSTVLLPTGGTARVLGHDVVSETKAVRPLIGIVFGGERGLYTRLTARKNLEYWAALYRLPAFEVKSRADSLLERVGLTERADQLARPLRYPAGVLGYPVYWAGDVLCLWGAFARSEARSGLRSSCSRTQPATR